jgi:hypothetical protein
MRENLQNFEGLG